MIKFYAEDEILRLGNKVLTAKITGLHNRHEPHEFAQYKQTELEKVKKAWRGKLLEDDPVINGFYDLHAKINKPSHHLTPSPEKLLWFLFEQGHFPRINTVVDIYNLVSMKSRLSLGAHDIAKVHGNVTLRFTKGNEIFVPLGREKPVRVAKGEYCYIDDENHIICRLEVRQCQETKVTPETRDVFLIVHGNAVTPAEYVESTAHGVCKLITRYCGGDYEFLNRL